MAEEITELESPIDAMALIHKALVAEGSRVQSLIDGYAPGDSLQNFRAAFNFWATALMYHADVEDQYMTGPIKEFQPARVNETEHRELDALFQDLGAYVDGREVTGLEGAVRRAIVALHEEQHAELMDRLEDVLGVLNEEIGRTRVIARTKRHLYGKVVALKICQDDHLESEEAFVLPEVRERMSDAEQLGLVSSLLVDPEAEDSRWILDWVAKDLTPGERDLLKDLESRFDSVFTAAD
jgi:hypothetical protein